MRWQAAGLCLAGGLCAAAGAILAALLLGDRSAAWATGLGAVVVAAALAIPLGFRAADGYARSLEAVVRTVRAWTDGHMRGRIASVEGDHGDHAELAASCNALADAVEERLRVQRRLADANAEFGRQSAELAALQERQRIARDLHDAVSQRLFGIHLLAATAARAPGAPATVTELEALSREAQREMRALLLQLRPPGLAARALPDALADLCAEARLVGATAWRLDIGALADLGPAAEDGLYRIAQEAVANVRRHAQARNATLSLRRAGDRVELAVDDDGRGFAPGERRPSGMGMPSMDERIRALGGALRITSQPGRGTRVEAVVPVVPAAAAGGLNTGAPAEAGMAAAAGPRAARRASPRAPDVPDAADADTRSPDAGARAPTPAVDPTIPQRPEPGGAAG